jgi:ribosome-associated protein
MRNSHARRAPEAPPEPSKTRRKQAMNDLQALGKALAAADRAKLAALDLPERLTDAIDLFRTITKHEARRRQLQYIGRLMREVDPAPIARALEGWSHVTVVEKAHFAALERWRDRLLAEDSALDDLLAQYPSADGARIRRLIDDAHRERAAGAPPHGFRELFRVLKSLAADSEAASEPPQQPEENERPASTDRSRERKP